MKIKFLGKMFSDKEFAYNNYSLFKTKCQYSNLEYCKIIMVIRMDYIEKLTQLRVDNDIPQSKIAEILNCKQSAISKYEQRRAKYKVEDIIRLCEFYGVSADYILGIPKGRKYPQR